MQTKTSVQADFAAAVAAFQRGDAAGARRWGLRVVEADPANGHAHHLLAAVAEQTGDVIEALTRFGKAVPLLPDDPQLANNFANALAAQGDVEGAMIEYRRAVALDPGFVEALVNLGLTAGLTYYDEGLDALRRATALDPGSAKVWLALGVLLREGGDLDAAREALARADALASRNPQIVQALAVVEAASGGDPLPYLDRASALLPGDPELALERAAALERRGDGAEAADYLAGLLRGAPAWQMGHLALSQLRWQLGEGATSTRSFEEALSKTPDDVELRLAWLSTLQRADRNADALALVDKDRERFAVRPEAESFARRIEAVAAAENGDLARAAPLFAAEDIGADVNFGVSAMRFLLRSQRPADAAALGERLLQIHDNRAIWAHLATAWRLTEDRRADWLDDARLIAVIDIEGLDLAALADTLRSLHVAKAHPFDQSLRGGTQTEGHLLLRSDPTIRALRQALDGAVGQYIADLPPPDPTHPTLRERRDGFRIATSWSVRLGAQGFHINHFHSEGWLSSAFYVALPPATDTGPAGWLSLGQPSVELGLDLPALATIHPTPGRLVLFPSTLWHGTIPFDDGERLTVAFDVVPKGR